ncbi:hypothetical protein CA7LBN_003479 [Candidozyma auris]|uniref:Sm protein G n=1 Tax=Candidozyma auris TaxID=498019 RepID=A0A8F2W2S3_CANAR|nr:hypothetical protein CA7LBN_003479 [[Candida] auris]
MRLSITTLKHTMVSAPELKNLLHTNAQYLDKSVVVELNGGRSVSGVLRGYDVFMNVTLAEALEHSKKDKLSLGTVVIRGNSILSVEATA